MEKLDLYTSEFARAGKSITRGMDVPDETALLLVFVCVFNEEGKLLIQRRALNKSYGGQWDVSAAGAVLSGESSLSAAARETGEEMGIHLAPEELTRVCSFYYEHHIHDIYTAHYDCPLSDLTLQKEEVMDAAWATREDVAALIEQRKFVGVYQEFIDLIFRMKDRRGIMTD